MCTTRLNPGIADVATTPELPPGAPFVEKYANEAGNSLISFHFLDVFFIWSKFVMHQKADKNESIV